MAPEGSAAARLFAMTNGWLTTDSEKPEVAKPEVVEPEATQPVVAKSEPAKLETETVKSEGEKFWGENGSPTFAMMLSRLVISIYDCARSVSTPVPQIEDAAKARPYVNTDMFRMTLILLNIHDLDISQEEMKYLTVERLDELHKAYYDLWGMKYEEFPRADMKTKAPLVRKCFLWGYINSWLNMYPDECHAKLNRMLAFQYAQFLDPFTDEKFQHTVIPRSFFPAKAPAGTLLFRSTCEANWRLTRQKLMAKFKNAAEKEQANLGNMMQQMQDRQTQMMINQMNNMSMMNAANAGLTAQRHSAVALANAMANQDAALGLPSTTYTYRYGYGNGNGNGNAGLW